MRSDNKIYTMGVNRFLSNWRVIPIIVATMDLFFFLCYNYIVNTLYNVVNIAKDVENAANYLGAENLLPHFAGRGTSVLVVYGIFFFVIFILDGILIYEIRVNLSDKELNRGQRGTARWTTKEEIRKQYKAIPYRDVFFNGAGGTIVSRQGKKLYIDDSHSNNLIIGTTRSGKGEMYVFPSIDVYSRAKNLEDRPSMVISDPKMELYKSARKKLEERGYIVRLLNLDDPYFSVGYNPMEIIVKYYKDGLIERAQMAARSFSFSVFAADNSSQEPIWKNTATDLFTAMMLAVATDCLEDDRNLNEKRRKLWAEKREAFASLDDEEKEIAEKRFLELKKTEEDVLLSEYISYIPPTEDFKEIYPNQKKVNCFSCLNFFREMCDTKALEQMDNAVEREKLAETALDEYFNNRPALDYAKSLYSEIKTTGDRTKGSVYINMQSALSIFALDNIARLTAENDIDFDEIGYGEKPVAIFIGVPSEDRSNHFLVTTFVSQVYQYLFRQSKIREGKKAGKLDRKVKIILDEFGQFPEVENFSGYVTVCLGLGISFDIYVQSLAQIPAKYKTDEKTIKENFANQIYIKSIGEDTAEEFSKILGTKTVVEVQRSGRRSSLDKHFTETVSEKPLIFAHELAKLKEGECVVNRGIKRSDRLGIAVDSHPIINEYADRLSLLSTIKVISGFIKERFIRGNAYKHPTENRKTKMWEEWLMRKDAKLREDGTALLYRYQYLQGTFPNPDEILLEDVNTESRSHIDYTSMVYTPEEALKKTALSRQIKSYRLLKEHDNYSLICKHLTDLDPHWRKKYSLSEESTLSQVIEAICQMPFNTQTKEMLIKLAS